MNENDEILEAIIPSFRGGAILFGLLSKKLDSVLYCEEVIDGKNIVIEKRILPNRFARMDVLRVNNEIAGTIVCCELEKNIYHMVGMFIREQFRSKSFRRESTNVFPKPQENKPISAANFLLKTFLRDVLKNNKQVTLEVLDHNKPAWNLYEKNLFYDEELNIQKGFRLMTEEEVLCYARARNKKIGKWHQVMDAQGRPGTGVQWSHVPDFDGTPRWSINRLYLIKLGSKPFSIRDSFKNRLSVGSKMAVSILQYGQPLHFLSKVITKA